MALKDMDKGYKFRAIGAFFVLIGMVGIIWSIKSDNDLFSIIGGFALIVGLIIASFGLTKIVVKKDPAYQDYLRKRSKQWLFYPLLVVFVFIIFGLAYIFASFWIALIGIIIAFIVAMYAQLSMYRDVYKLGEYVSQQNPEDKKKSVFLLIILIVVGIVLWYFINFVILKGKAFS